MRNRKLTAIHPYVVSLISCNIFKRDNKGKSLTCSTMVERIMDSYSMSHEPWDGVP